MPRKPRIPSYRLHKPSGQAVVRLNGRDFYLGKHGSAQSQEAYERLIAEWLAGNRRPQPTLGTGLSVSEVILAYWQHAQKHYRRKDGTSTSEVRCIRIALRPVRRLYGQTPAAEFGPLALKAVRQEMIQAGLCRTSINQNVGRVKRMFKWAASEELVPAGAFHALQTVAGLQKGRTEAKESDPVTPVPEDHVRAVLPFVSPQIRAMVELQLLTGMRPGEVRLMRTCDLVIEGVVWTYVPGSHKTEHKGHCRVIYLGPKAQAILKPYLKLDTQAFLFSPREAMALRNAERRRNRRTPLTPSQIGRQPKSNPKRCPGECYTVSAYAHAVEKACRKAGVPHWHPHQLRHNAATYLRKEFGVELARIILGHKTAFTTEIYAEADRQKAIDVMRQIG